MRKVTFGLSVQSWGSFSRTKASQDGPLPLPRQPLLLGVVLEPAWGPCVYLSSLGRAISCLSSVVMWERRKTLADGNAEKMKGKDRTWPGLG